MTIGEGIVLAVLVICVLGVPFFDMCVMPWIYKVKEEKNRRL